MAISTSRGNMANNNDGNAICQQHPNGDNSVMLMPINQPTDVAQPCREPVNGGSVNQRSVGDQCSPITKRPNGNHGSQR